MPSLPLELLYLIIDSHLAHESQTLLALSQVSRALMLAARHHLFHTLSLTSSNCSAALTKRPVVSYLAGVLLNPSVSTVLPVVRVVEVENGEWERRWMNETIPRLNVLGDDGGSVQARSPSTTSACAPSSEECSAPLPSEQHSDVDVDSPSDPRFGPTTSRATLPFSDTGFGHASLCLPLVHTLSLSAAQDPLEQGTLSALSRIFPNVKTLKIKDFEIVDPSEVVVARVLRAFPCLEMLRIDGAWCSDADVGFEDVMGTAAVPLSAWEQDQAVGQVASQEEIAEMDLSDDARHLETLDLVCTTPDILAAFTNLRVRVQTLKMHYLTESEVPIVSEYLRFLGEDLHHLTLGYLGFTPQTKLTVAANTSLQSLTVVFPHYNTTLFTSAPGSMSRTSSISSAFSDLSCSSSSRPRSRSSSSTSLTGARLFLSTLAPSSPLLRDLTFAWRGAVNADTVDEWIDGMGAVFEPSTGYHGAQDESGSLKCVERVSFYIGEGDESYVDGVDESDVIEGLVREEFKGIARFDYQVEAREVLEVSVRREKLKM